MVQISHEASLWTAKADLHILYIETIKFYDRHQLTSIAVSWSTWDTGWDLSLLGDVPEPMTGFNLGLQQHSSDATGR